MKAPKHTLQIAHYVHTHTLYLSVAELAVIVLIHLTDHVLQADMSLRSTQLLHHHLQLHQIDVAVLPRVKSMTHPQL